MGLSRPHTTSSGLGIIMLSLDSEKFFSEAAMAVPPPLLAPGLGVEMYFIPFICKSSSSFSLCSLHSDFSQTSESRAKSMSLSWMSSARLSSLDQIDLMLYTVNEGRLWASSSLLSLRMVLMTGGSRKCGGDVGGRGSVMCTVMWVDADGECSG